MPWDRPSTCGRLSSRLNEHRGELPSQVIPSLGLRVRTQDSLALAPAHSNLTTCERCSLTSTGCCTRSSATSPNTFVACLFLNRLCDKLLASRSSSRVLGDFIIDLRSLLGGFLQTWHSRSLESPLTFLRSPIFQIRWWASSEKLNATRGFAKMVGLPAHG